MMVWCQSVPLSTAHAFPSTHHLTCARFGVWTSRVAAAWTLVVCVGRDIARRRPGNGDIVSRSPKPAGLDYLLILARGCLEKTRTPRLCSGPALTNTRRVYLLLQKTILKV